MLQYGQRKCKDETITFVFISHFVERTDSVLQCLVLRFPNKLTDHRKANFGSRKVWFYPKLFHWIPKWGELATIGRNPMAVLKVRSIDKHGQFDQSKVWSIGKNCEKLVVPVLAKMDQMGPVKVRKFDQTNAQWARRNIIIILTKNGENWLHD